tara:strand:- start:321 stop:443 length:123 start_codon:yes stop_codon:yes gene_type:complete
MNFKTINSVDMYQLVRTYLFLGSIKRERKTKNNVNTITEI